MDPDNDTQEQWQRELSEYEEYMETADEEEEQPPGNARLSHMASNAQSLPKP